MLHLFRHHFPHAVKPSGLFVHRYYVGAHLFGATGQFPQSTYVQVRIHGQRHGARNGGCGHDERVRNLPAAFLAQLFALFDTEPVLLIDDNDPQFVEDGGVGQERVCSHDNVHDSSCEFRGHAFAFAPGHGAGEQFDSHAVGEPVRGELT